MKSKKKLVKLTLITYFFKHNIAKSLFQHEINVEVLMIHILHSFFHIESLKPGLIQSGDISSAQWPRVTLDFCGGCHR